MKWFMGIFGTVISGVLVFWFTEGDGFQHLHAEGFRILESMKNQQVPEEIHIFFRDKYRDLPDHRAIALALDSDGVHVWGYSYSFVSQDQANEEAIYQCKIRRSNFPVNAECRIYAVGENIIW